MDIWSDEELDRLEQLADYALRTEDDGRALIVAPQAVKDLITAVRDLRAQAGGTPASEGRASAAGSSRPISRSEGAGPRPA
jgi:hypothetical protein